MKYYFKVRYFFKVRCHNAYREILWNILVTKHIDKTTGVCPQKKSSNWLAERMLPVFILLTVTLTLYVHGYFQDVCKCQGQCSKKCYFAILTLELFHWLTLCFSTAERVGWLFLSSVCNGKLSEKRSRMEQEVSCI